MRYQAELAIEQADVIVLVTDLQAGVTASDADVGGYAAKMRQAGGAVRQQVRPDRGSAARIL